MPLTVFMVSESYMRPHLRLDCPFDATNVSRRQVE